MLRGELTEGQTKEFARRDVERIAFTLLAVQGRLAQQQAHGTNTLLAAIPQYQMPAAKKGKKPKRNAAFKKVTLVEAARLLSQISSEPATNAHASQRTSPKT